MSFSSGYSNGFQKVSGSPLPFAFEQTATKPPVTQTTAKQITATTTVFVNVVPGAACVLPAVTTSQPQYNIINRGQASLLVYPSVGWAIEGQPVNQPVTIPPNGEATFLARNPNLKLAPLWYAY